jgi:hypothetical protein
MTLWSVDESQPTAAVPVRMIQARVRAASGAASRLVCVIGLQA